MNLNNVPLDERTEKALRLMARVNSLHTDIKRFVGEANVGYDDGIHEVRRIASEGIITATQRALGDEVK